MGEPERGEALLFFSLFFAQVKDPKAREIIFEGAHREGAKEQRSKGAKRRPPLRRGGQRLKSGESGEREEQRREQRRARGRGRPASKKRRERRERQRERLPWQRRRS
jgi:hypothetical protein